MIYYMIFPDLSAEYKYSVVSIIDPPLYDGVRVTYEYDFDTTDPKTVDMFVKYVNERTVWDLGFQIWDKAELIDDGENDYTIAGMYESYIGNIRSLHDIYGTVFVHTEVGMHQLDAMEREFKDDLRLVVVDIPVPDYANKDALVDCTEVLNHIAEREFAFYKWRGGLEYSHVLKRDLADSGYRDAILRLRLLKPYRN